MRRSKSGLLHFAFPGPQARGSQRRADYRPLLERLEDKTLLSGIVPTYQVFQPQTGAAAHPLLGPMISPPGLSPAQVSAAYGISGITFQSNGQTVAGDGSGQTVAIVDAYDDPSIAADLTTFDNQFFPGGAAPTFLKVGIGPTGNASTTSFPTANSGWAGEIELDVEWTHAIAPNANILLVEANSASDTDLLAAVDFARNYTGQFGGTATSAVSMSWGGGEFSGQTQDDTHFTTPSGHTGVTFFASSGDNGAPSGWPATSSHVVGVGGTTLNVDSAGDYLGETGWSGSGGGLSTVVAQPSYQSGLVIHNGSQVVSANGKRAAPDVAYDADPNTGVAVYGSFGFGGWAQIGGTSTGSPQWAALIAIANQGRTLAGLGTLDGFTQTLPDLYKFSADFNDITSGSNGHSAGPGFDLVTGLGTPEANKLIPDLVGNNTGGGGATPPTITSAASATFLTPTTATLTVAATDAAGANSLTYTWATVGTPPAAVTFSPDGTNAAQTSTATFSRVGTYTFQVTVTDPAGLTATSQVSFTVAAALTSVTVSPASASVADGGTWQFTASARDQFGAALTAQPAFTWSLDTGSLGTITTAGLYQAPASGTGGATVRATTGTVSGTAQVTVTSATGPTITTAAHVTAQTATTVTLAVAATDPAGATSLTYTWVVTGTPPAPVTFNRNGTNAAKTVTATFRAVGTYSFQVTVRDPSGLTATSSVTVTVSPVLKTLTVAPASVTLTPGGTQVFTASAADQFGKALAAPPPVTWSVSGPGTISPTGAQTALFTAGTGSAVVIATSGGVTAQATVTIPGSTTTFSSTDVPAPIEYLSITISYLTINQDITIGSLKAMLNITYPHDGDLAIDLISPQGTDVALSYFEGFGANFLNTTFDDNAALPIYLGNSPFAGSYQPETPLAALAGQDARGTWMLVVSDYGFSNGRLNAWSLTIQPAQMLATRTSGLGGAQAVIPTRGETFQVPGAVLAVEPQRGAQGPPRWNAVLSIAREGLGNITNVVTVAGQGGDGLSEMVSVWGMWELELGV